MTNCLQRPLFWGPKGGRCSQFWLYFKCNRHETMETLGKFNQGKDYEYIYTYKIYGFWLMSHDICHLTLEYTFCINETRLRQAELGYWFDLSLFRLSTMWIQVI